MENRRLVFERIWSSSVDFMNLIRHLSPKIAIDEWPAHCVDWKFESVEKLYSKHQLMRISFDGCMVGIDLIHRAFDAASSSRTATSTTALCAIIKSNSPPRTLKMTYPRKFPEGEEGSRLLDCCCCCSCCGCSWSSGSRRQVRTTRWAPTAIPGSRCSRLSLV